MSKSSSHPKLSPAGLKPAKMSSMVETHLDKQLESIQTQIQLLNLLQASGIKGIEDHLVVNTSPLNSASSSSSSSSASSSNLSPSQLDELLIGSSSGSNEVFYAANELGVPTPDSPSTPARTRSNGSSGSNFSSTSSYDFCSTKSNEVSTPATLSGGSETSESGGLASEDIHSHLSLYSESLAVMNRAPGLSYEQQQHHQHSMW